jgi:cyanophycin synthetase
MSAPRKPRPAKTKSATPEPKSKPVAKPAPAPLANTPWTIPHGPHSLPGLGFGLPYPAVILQCFVPATTPEQRAELAQRFEALFEGAKGLARLEPFSDPASGSERRDTIVWFCAIAARLQQMADLPVHAQPRAIGFGGSLVSFAVPALARGLEPTGALLALACKAFTASRKPEREKLRKQAHEAFRRLLGSALTTSNTPRLVKAAVENGIAFQEFPGSLVQYGIGRKSVLMDSTFTHYCSNIGARLAKYKQLSAGVLRRSGLPAPPNGIAMDESQALEIARRLGYPVVVKPADKDGGIAVQADLRTEDEVKTAFAAAYKVSKSVLVERFIAGRDYRITVFRGKAVWAVERVPASVTGDGSATIRGLVEATNADPRRGSTVYAALKKIKLDAEAEALLARDGLTFDSVPAAGQFVRLRRSSNVSSGGMPVVVTDRMHPDNARLAERAATVIGLDLAGIDLIIPDIATSWREIESGICEVNAQPELGGVTAGHLYPLVLKSLVGGNGHIPTVAVLGGARADELTASLVAALAAQGLCVGNHDRAGVHVGSETILPGQLNALRGGRILTMDRRVEAILLGVIDPTILLQGLPVQNIDALLVTGDLPSRPDSPAIQTRQVLRDMLRMILPHCRNVVLLDTGDTFDPGLRAVLEQLSKTKRTVSPGEHGAFLANLVKGITTAARKARQAPARASRNTARQSGV